MSFFSMKKQAVLLIFLLIVLVGLFSFSSWTNAKVVTENVDLTPGLDLASRVTPVLIGILLVFGLAIVVLISVDVR
jgi:hypothetical protein